MEKQRYEQAADNAAGSDRLEPPMPPQPPPLERSRAEVRQAHQASRAVAACLPQPSEAEAALLFGKDPAAEAPTAGTDPPQLVSGGGLTPHAA